MPLLLIIGLFHFHFKAVHLTSLITTYHSLLLLLHLTLVGTDVDLERSRVLVDWSLSNDKDDWRLSSGEILPRGRIKV